MNANFPEWLAYLPSGFAKTRQPMTDEISPGALVDLGFGRTNGASLRQRLILTPVKVLLQIDSSHLLRHADLPALS